MQISAIHAVYFSATYTTRKVVREIARRSGAGFTEHDITQHLPKKNTPVPEDAPVPEDNHVHDSNSIPDSNPISENNPIPENIDISEDILIPEDGLLITGVPVYAGRIPPMAAERLNKFKGNRTPAIIVCVYGNRDYDDALLELNDLMVENGFLPVSAAAFIAQHSIFPTVGTHRPDPEDIEAIRAFGDKSFAALHAIDTTSSISELKIKGNKPYKIPGKIPLTPKGNRRCTECDICVKLCPVQAIPKEAPRSTDKDKCISCGRCIVVCPEKARHFGGPLYTMANRKFIKANAAPKEPEYFFQSVANP